MTRLALLPAAVLAPLELQAEFGEVPSGMVPLDSRPVLLHVAEVYRARGYDVAVAVHDRADVIEDAFASRRDLGVQLLGIGRSSCIGETVLRALRRLPDSEHLVVNFADTVLAEDLGAGDVLAYQEQDDSYRWTTFDLDDRGQLQTIVDKGRDKGPGRSKVFIGVFGFADPGRLREELETAVASRSASLDPFWTALRRYVNASAPQSRRLHRAQRWFDVGHLDTYYTTRRRWFLNSRSFNSVEVDASRGVIRKSSDNADKFADEVRWSLQLPRNLRHVAPRVFDHDLLCSPPWVEMEFYGYPTLNDAYLVGQWDGGLWRQALRAVGGLLDSFTAQQDPRGAELDTLRCRQQMYEHKTRERLATAVTDPAFAWLRGDDVRVNGAAVMGLDEVVERLPELLATSGALSDLPFGVVHGDLCLSNILYDRRNSIVRVVDPRGSFGVPGVYGDPLYDLAKLSHSLHGDYDLYVNGLFDCSRQDDGGLLLRPHLQTRHLMVKQLFAEWLTDRVGPRLTALRLVEGLLFLSMLPLHADRPRSQQAFAARGLQLVTTVSESLAARTGTR